MTDGAGHPEVEGTMGQIEGGMYLVETVADVAALQVNDPNQLAYVSQTTPFSHTIKRREIVAVLRARFPAIQSPKKTISVTPHKTDTR